MRAKQICKENLKKVIVRCCAQIIFVTSERDLAMLGVFPSLCVVGLLFDGVFFSTFSMHFTGMVRLLHFLIIDVSREFMYHTWID